MSAPPQLPPPVEWEVPVPQASTAHCRQRTPSPAPMEPTETHPRGPRRTTACHVSWDSTVAQRA